MKQPTFSTHLRSQSDAQHNSGIWPRRFLALFLLLLAGLLAACQPIRPVPAIPSEVESSDAAIAVVQAYYAALNDAVQDPAKIDLAMEYLADNALFINPTGSYETLEEIRASLAGGATEGITFDLSNFRNTAGRVAIGQ